MCKRRHKKFDVCLRFVILLYHRLKRLLIHRVPEEQRKLFTVEFGPRRDSTWILLQDSLAQTRRHNYDNSSLEYKGRLAFSIVKIKKYEKWLTE